MEEKSVTIGENRKENGTFDTGNQFGTIKQTEEKKLVKKAVKEYIKEYQEKLAEALPTISPVLIKKANEGDIPAIKELHDRVMGKAPMKAEVDLNTKLEISFDEAFKNETPPSTKENS